VPQQRRRGTSALLPAPPALWARAMRSP